MAKIDLEGVAGASSSDSWEGFTKNFQENIANLRNRSKFGQIESDQEFTLDEDLLWDTAMKKYHKDYSVIDLLESTGIYTEDGNRVAMIALLSIDTIADEVIGSSSTKDF